MDAGIGILGILSLLDAPEIYHCDLTLHYFLSLNPPCLYITFLPYHIPAPFMSLSLPFLSITWWRAEHHSLHLVDMLSSGPEVGAVELKLQIRCLCWLWYTPHPYASIAPLGYVLWHFQSCRLNSFEIHCSENVTGMSHCWAHQTWLYITGAARCWSKVEVRIWSSSNLKTAGLGEKKKTRYSTGRSHQF